MTTGRINQVTIFKHYRSAESPKRNLESDSTREVRFVKLCMIRAAITIAKASLPPRRTSAFMACNQLERDS